MSTYFDRIESQKKKVFESAVKKKEDSKKRDIHLSEAEEAFAKRTIHLASDPGFKECLQFWAGHRAALLTHPYKKSPYCDREDFEYQIGFNDGFFKGMLFTTSDIDRIWNAYLINLQNKGTNDENEKSAS